MEPGFLDRVRILCGDLLDLHAALGTGHHHRAALGAIDDDAEVILLGDVDGLGEHDLAHLDALRAGLLRDHRLGEHALARILGSLVGVLMSLT